MHLQYNIHRIRPSKFRPQNDPNTHTPKTNSAYCIFRDKCILRLRSHTSITENTIPRKFDVQYSECRTPNYSKYCTPNLNLTTPKRKIQYLEKSNYNTSKTECRKFRCKVAISEEMYIRCNVKITPKVVTNNKSK